MKQIAIGGSSANPVHRDHLALLDDLCLGSHDFDSVFWIPCGERPDKHFAVCPNCPVAPDEYCHMCSNHRIAMIEMTVGLFRGLSRQTGFSILYDDVFNLNTPTIIWLERLARQYPQAELTWVTGADSVVPRREFGGRNEIQAVWFRGEELWQSRCWNWLIYERPGFSLASYDYCLPPNARVTKFVNNCGLSSSHIRNLIATGSDSWEDMVTAEVACYIKQWGLYGYKEKS
jgi:nicotinic acid mononucleotide adenylyltransferase